MDKVLGRKEQKPQPTEEPKPTEETKTTDEPKTIEEIIETKITDEPVPNNNYLRSLSDQYLENEYWLHEYKKNLKCLIDKTEPLTPMDKARIKLIPKWIKEKRTLKKSLIYLLRKELDL